MIPGMEPRGFGNPLSWLLSMCFTLLACVVVLRIVFWLLAAIWPWLVAVAVVGVGIWAVVHLLTIRSRKW